MASDNKKVLIIVGIVAGVLLVSCLACGGIALIALPGALSKVQQAADTKQRLTDLNQVGLAIYMYFDSTKKMPAKADDLVPFVDAKIAQRLRSGEIDVVWNAVPFHMEDRGPSNVIIAWDTKPVEGNQRLVCFMDRAVRTINEADFEAIPKARTSQDKGKK